MVVPASGRHSGPGWIVGLLLSAAGCGGGAVDLSPFLGTWTGTVAVSGGGAPTSNPSSLIVIEIDSRTVELVGFCSDASGPRATASAADKLTVGEFSCPAVSVSGCSSVTVSTQGGTATVESGVLALHIEATVSGCSQTEPVTFDFTGTRDGSSPVANQ
ncbi:MAG TPA: hypothetical protein VLW85_01895, partial [Myxococcales bacterium]|nr:hypothetical protein [Myxococcales bacterium]